MTDLVPVRRALISLSDKTGLDELAAGLTAHVARVGRLHARALAQPEARESDERHGRRRLGCAAG